MYNILIVDDEYNVREGLKYIINWQDYGFQIAGDASNGKSALEYMRETKIHLVITDIKMPVMDGLELLMHLGKQYPPVKVIVLSGYNDFNYAKTALRHGAVDYLLKPVDEEELISILEKIKHDMDNNADQIKKETMISRVIRDKVLNDIIVHMHSGKHIKKLLDQHGLCLQEGWHLVILFESDSDTGGENESNPALIPGNPEIREILDEVLDSGYNGYPFCDTETRFGVLLGGGDKEGLIENAGKFIRCIVPGIQRCTQSSFTFGVGTPVCGNEQIHLSYLHAKHALENGFFNKKESIVFYYDENPPVNGVGKRIDIDCKTLVNKIMTCEYEGLESETEKVFNSIIENYQSVQEVRGHILKVMMEVSKAIADVKKDMAHMYADISELYGIMESKKKAEDLKSFFNEFCLGACGVLMKLWETTPREVIGKTLEYINNHYSEDISLKQISQNVFFCQSYLGKLFKQAVGENFNEYLTKVRIEKAQYLLLNTELKIYEVSSLVGYKSIDYFRKQFKAVTGIGPVEFKASRRR